MRARHAGEPVPGTTQTFGDAVRRGEVAYIDDQGCLPAYTISAVQLDEPPWDRYLDQPIGRFICPSCRKGLIMHLHWGPGMPASERFGEVA